MSNFKPPSLQAITNGVDELQDHLDVRFIDQKDRSMHNVHFCTRHDIGR